MARVSAKAIDPDLRFPRRYRRSMITTFILAVLVTLLVNLLSPPIVRSVAFIALPPGSTSSQNVQHLTIVDSASIIPPDSLPLKTFDFTATPTDQESVVALSVEAEGKYFQAVPKVADEWAAAAIARLGPQATVLRTAGPSVLVRPDKMRNFIIGIFIGALASFYIATWREIFRQLDIREILLGEPVQAVEQPDSRGKRMLRKRAAPRRTPWQRSERIVRVSIGYSVLICVIITLFTPPTFESKAVIELPNGLSVSQAVAQLRLDLNSVAPHDRPSFGIWPEVKPVGDDSPAIAALTISGSTQQPEAYSVLADAWADCAVAQLGNGASVLAHADPANVPVKPKKVQDIFIGSLLGFFIGCFIALIAEVRRYIRGQSMVTFDAGQPVTTLADVLSWTFTICFLSLSCIA